MPEEPQSLVDQIGDEVLELAKTRAELEGAELVKMLTVIVTDGLAPNATLAGYGYDGDEELFFSLLTTCKNVGKSLGMDLEVHYINQPGQG